MTTPSIPNSVAGPVARAADAYRAVSRSTPRDRSNWLHALADALDTSQELLVRLASSETGLTSARLTGEVARTSGQLRLFGRVVDEGSFLEATIDPPRTVDGVTTPDLRRVLTGLGPAAVYSASNFPFAFSVLGGDTAAAIAAGCPVVVKIHSGHPELSEHVLKIANSALEAAGAPEGLLNAVRGRPAGLDLIVHPEIRSGAFTGSRHAGRILFDLASRRPDPVPFYGELGSLNPVVVGPIRSNERLGAIASGLVHSVMLGQGQFCTKPGLVLVPADSPLPGLVASGLDVVGSRLLTESISSAFDTGVNTMIGIPGVEILAQGTSKRDESALSAPQTPPTFLITDVPTVESHRDALLEECFGPVTLLVRYRDVVELESLLLTLDAALTGTLHLDQADLPEYASVIEALEGRSGRVVFDGWPTGVAVTWAMHHGGPWPATTNPLFTSVGATAVRRFQRPLVYQDAPDSMLPPSLLNENPWHLPRRVNGVLLVATESI